MSVFILEEYKQYLLSYLLCKAVYKKVDITERLLDSLCQFTIAPSTFLGDLPQIVVSRKHRQMFDLTSKPSSAQANDWFLYNFGYKHCTSCKEIKSIFEYKKDTSKWNNLQHICAFCANEQNKEYRIQNPEYAKAYQIHNAESIKAYKQQYRLDNLGKFANYSAKRRATKLQATPSWLTTAQLDEIKNYYSLASAITKTSKISYHVDHIVPLQGKNVCGLHVPWNLQIITATDNVRKNNKHGDF